MIKYTIPGIGQGCCVEQVAYINCEKHRILYDCGSDNTYALKNYIDTLDASIPTTLVISHLHDDHINGIPYLVDHFKKNNCKIKKLYLPLYSHEILVLFAMSIIATGTEGSFEEDNRLIRFIFNPQENEDFREIAYVASDNYENNDIERVRGNIINDSMPQKIVELSNRIYWAMKFWVDPDVYKMLTPANKKQLNEFGLEDFKDKKKEKDIKDIYQRIKRSLKIDFNQTSMLMATYFHFDWKAKNSCLTHGEFNCLSFFLNDGFVCTGDYPFKKKKINKGKKIHEHYSVQQILINKMMVPHHGSGINSCDYIPFDFIKTAYAQNGVNNRYNHPGQNVINFLEDLGIEFINRQNKI